MLYKKIFLFTVGIITILIGFFYNENSSGGAIHDSNYLLPFIQAFGNDLNEGFKLLWSNSGSLVHSPIFYIFSGKILSIFGNLNYVKISYIFLSSLLPFIFYNILKLRIRNDIYIFIFSLIIFTSPYFRSSAIWLLGDNLSLIFFGISIFFYLRFQKNNNIIFCYLCILSLSICCYVRYYYCPYFIYYIYIFSKKLNIKEILKLLIFSFLISLPAIIYFIYLIKFQNFLMFVNLHSGHNVQNYITNFIVILTIFLFYITPFLIVFFKEFIIYCSNEKKRIFNIFLFFISIFLVDHFFYNKLIFFRELNYGGGVIKKLIDLVSLNSEILMILVSTLSFIILDFIFLKNRTQNFILLFCIVLSLPFVYIFQKYLDPLLFLIIFGLIKSEYVELILKKLKKNIILYYGYFLIFFIIALTRY